jgi:hypothetical protein
MERFGPGRPPLSAVLPVLKSAADCPPGAVIVRCDLPVLLHALLYVAINAASRAVSLSIYSNPRCSPPTIAGVHPRNCVQHDQRLPPAITT